MKNEQMQFGLNQAIAGGIAIAIVCFGGGYYIGKTFGVSAPQRGQFAGQFGSGSTRTGGVNGRNMNGFAAGTILAKDASSITVQLGGQGGAANGSSTGSRIVILGSSTQVGKFVSGAVSDLEVGQEVLVTGSPNSDGSITAQQIQIRPAGMTGPGFGGPRGDMQR